MNIIEKIKDIHSLFDEKSFNPYYLVDETLNWPQIPDFDSADFDEKGDLIVNENSKLEILDPKNYKITEVSERYLIIKCSGDWQNLYEVKIELDSKNQLIVTSYKATDFNMEDKKIDMNELLKF